MRRGLQATRGHATTAVSRLRPRNGRRPHPIESAKAAGLRYTSDTRPGIRRRRNGSGFVYLTAEGRPIRSAAELRRIRALVIPPAWRDVWICPDPAGHLQATGRDARGRKQYRYHPRWHEVRDETKYHRMLGFAQALPRIRRRTAEHLRTPRLTREKVLATVVQLLEKTLIRVGNGEYVKQNRSFGLTTMRDGHVEVARGRVRFSFKGKSGVEHDVDLSDRRLAKIVKACRDIPGYDLFQYYDENGERQSIGSADVNAYLKEIAGQDYTSKDFRTWAGTVLAAQMLKELDRADSETQLKRNVVEAVESVAKRLGNTKAVCRKCYIHPAVLDAYMDGSMLETVSDRARRVARRADALSGEELSVLNLLQRRLARETKRRAS
jgi:DNA topoisomerase-1